MNYINPQSKLLKHIDTIAEIKAGGTPPPVNVEIDLSNRCNLGCKGCHFAHTHTRGHFADDANIERVGDLMETSTALEILRDLHLNNVKSVTWTGGGEPTLHPDFERILEYASRMKLEQGIYTNGTNIDEYRAGFLKKTCKWVYVSLDRADRESYKQYKQADLF